MVFSSWITARPPASCRFSSARRLTARARDRNDPGLGSREEWTGLSRRLRVGRLRPWWKLGHDRMVADRTLSNDAERANYGCKHRENAEKCSYRTFLHSLIKPRSALPFWRRAPAGVLLSASGPRSNFVRADILKNSSR